MRELMEAAGSKPVSAVSQFVSSPRAAVQESNFESRELGFAFSSVTVNGKQKRARHRPTTRLRVLYKFQFAILEPLVTPYLHQGFANLQSLRLVTAAGCALVEGRNLTFKTLSGRESFAALR